MRCCERAPPWRPCRALGALDPFGVEALLIQLEQSMAIQVWLVDGVARATEVLSEKYLGETEVDVGETVCCALGDFGTDGLQSEDDELIAGALLAFRGAFCGAALLAMEPDAALGWARSADPSADAIRVYLALAEQMLRSVVESAASVLDVSTEIGRPKLEERSLGGTLLQTHAPSDTAVIGSRLEIFVDGAHFPARIFLLTDSKTISGILRALRVSSN